MSSQTISAAGDDLTVGDGRQRRPRWWRVTARAVAALVAVGVVGAGLEALAERRDSAAHPAPGELVTLTDGRRLHLDVQGRDHDGPVVVLETGMGGFSAAWGWIQPELAEQATVVSYDRPGLGWSDPSPHGPDAEHVVADLRQALEASGLAGRGYVLVGHSLGGHYVRAFAQQHPDEVVGMVLVDPSHERQADELPGYDRDMASGRVMMRALQATARVGLNRLYDPLATVVSGLPEPQRSQALAAQVTPGYFQAYRAEFAALDEVGAAVAASDTGLGDLPLTVLIAGHSPSEDGQAVVDAAVRLRQELPGLSTRGRHRLLPDADHVSIVTERQHAAVVTDTVRDMVATVAAR